MQPRRKAPSFFGNPVLIGALTMLVVVVATLFAYQANNGLPFQPSYRFKLDIPNAGHLTKNAQIRMGGTRVGQVISFQGIRNDDGTVAARLELKLFKRLKPLPADTRFRIEPVSNTGLDYVKILRGHSSATIAEGSVVPRSQVLSDTVPLEDFLGTFTARTRQGIRRNLQGYAYGLAGRGPQLNKTIGQLVPLLRDLTPVARLLSRPSTGLGRFVDALGSLSAEVAPVAEQQANGFSELNDTFEALSRDRRALGDFIDQGPASEDAIVRNAPSITRFLRASTGLSKSLRPASRALPTAASTLALALRAGVNGLPATTQSLPRVDELTRHLADFGSTDVVNAAVDRLRLTGRSLAPLTSYITPAETTCRYASLLLRNLASAFREGPTSGNAFRAVLLATTAAKDSEAILAQAPSNNPDDLGLGALHANPYPNTAAPGQPRECEAGQELFVDGTQVIGNTAVREDTTTESPKLP